MGSPPPFGDKLVQNIVWFKCPPPLNFKAGCSAIVAAKSPIEKQLDKYIAL